MMVSLMTRMNEGIEIWKCGLEFDPRGMKMLETKTNNTIERKSLYQSLKTEDTHVRLSKILDLINWESLKKSHRQS